ncbi:MAG: hypothetical protein A3I33_00905 [Candidatus Colwellbacteria bacterium RIFCSPLOWO2_02_FULL_45_11]|uniref:Alpha-galactosidase NEW3 domain-containing protein n=1 Tax=Candidatus Colwellbacteria bacterium RIFCSPLOWO2_02_FULL_45_11 TaxID=1797692 RepID=A0A1G1Z8X2_9BACT|nr:MAG: hypothetical protein A3I33_00905 [Candidatus Colwellbacteria bacterium RIFCSPLOWO2_02_FULL_45_11]
MQGYAGKNSLIVGASIVLGALILLAPQAHAQSIGFSVSKNIFDIETPAGTSYSDTVVVLNNPESLVTPIHIELAMWNLAEDSEDIEFITAEPALNATTWFTFDDGRDLILEPGEERELDFEINIPADTPPGSYLVAMRFQSVLPEYYFENEGPRFIPELDILLFIRVPLLTLEGDQSLYSAQIDSLSPNGDKVPIVQYILPKADAGVFDAAVEKLLAEIRNDGIYHFKMSGTIEINNIFGRTVASRALPGRILIPNRTRSIEIPVLTSPDVSDLSFFERAFKSMAYKLRTNTYFGPYNAVAILSVPENDLPVVKSVSFWVIPWQFWLTLAVIILGGLMVFRRFGHKLIGRFRLFIKILIGRIKPSL